MRSKTGEQLRLPAESQRKQWENYKETVKKRHLRNSLRDSP